MADGAAQLDLSRYEGHAPSPWVQSGTDDGELYVVRDANGAIIIALSSAWRGAEPTTLLAADAPALLAEVKRLREEVASWKADAEKWYGKAIRRKEAGDV